MKRMRERVGSEGKRRGVIVKKKRRGEKRGEREQRKGRVVPKRALLRVQAGEQGSVRASGEGDQTQSDQNERTKRRSAGKGRNQAEVCIM